MKSEPNGTSTAPTEADPRGKSTSPAEAELRGKSVTITETTLAVELEDGRVIITPLEWYPSLKRATPEQRAAWKWWGPRRALHWPALDEHLGIEGMLRGIPSIEYRRQLAPAAHAAS